MDLSCFNMRVVPGGGAKVDQKIRSMRDVDAWVMQKLGEGHGAAGSGGGLPWGEWVGLRDIYEAYATWAAKQKDIWKPQGIVIFGREMDRVMGGPHGLPKRNQGQGIGWQKRLPGLDEMRATMERRLGGGGIDWGTGSDEAGEGETLLG